MAPWRSGYAAVCKTAYTGSNPVGASTNYGRVAELVYATDLKSVGLNSLEGSSPSSPTTKKTRRCPGVFSLGRHLVCFGRHNKQSRAMSTWSHVHTNSDTSSVNYLASYACVADNLSR